MLHYRDRLRSFLPRRRPSAHPEALYA
jgi:hypothetical protein